MNLPSTFMGKVEKDSETIVVQVPLTGLYAGRQNGEAGWGDTGGRELFRVGNRSWNLYS